MNAPTSPLPPALPLEGLIVSAPMTAATPVSGGLVTALPVYPDLSGKLNGRQTTNACPAQLVTDEVVGPCLEFPGTPQGRLTLPRVPLDFSGGMTLCVWLRFRGGVKTERVIQLWSGSDMVAQFTWDKTVSRLNLTFTIKGQVLAPPATPLIDWEDRWYHVALVYSPKMTAGTGAQFYRDGSLVYQSNPGSNIPSAQISDACLLDAGKTPTRLVGLAVYNRPLSAGEISVVQATTAPTRSLRTTHPLAVRMFDERGHAALHLDDGTPHQLLVETENAGTQNLVLTPSPAKGASEKDWHLQLILRQSVVDVEALKRDLPTAFSTPNWTGPTGTLKWSIVVQAAADDVWVRVYALCLEATPPPLAPRQSLRFALPLQSPRGIGARGTHVQVIPNPSAVVIGSVGVSGPVSHHLQIIDGAAGDGAAAVGVGGYFQAQFVGAGGNRVCNDTATTTALTLRIQPAPSVLKNLLDSADWSKFELAIVLPTDITAAAPRCNDGSGFSDGGSDGQVRKLKLAPNSRWPAQPLEVTFNDVKTTNGLAGLTEVRIRIKNLPLAAGVNDEFGLVVEKAPLLFTNASSTFAGDVIVKGNTSLRGQIAGAPGNPLVVRSAHPNTVVKIGDSGVAIMQNIPNLGLNCYFDSGWKTMSDQPWGAIISLHHGDGAISFSSGRQVGNTFAANGKLELSELLRIESDPTKPSSFQSKLRVGGETVLCDGLSVEAETRLKSNLTVLKDTTLNGALNVSGAAKFGSYVNVTGGGKFGGDVAVGGNLAIPWQKKLHFNGLGDSNWQIYWSGWQDSSSMPGLPTEIHYGLCLQAGSDNESAILFTNAKQKVLLATQGDTGETTINGALSVTGYKSITIKDYGYLSSTKTATGTGATANFSIIATARVLAPEVNANCDRRLKDHHDTLDQDEALRAVCALNPVRYQRRVSFTEPATAESPLESGFYAQEVAEQIPTAAACIEHKDSPDGKQWILSPNQLHAYTTGAIQALAAQVEALTALVQKQAAEIARLQATARPPQL